LSRGAASATCSNAFWATRISAGFSSRKNVEERTRLLRKEYTSSSVRRSPKARAVKAGIVAMVKASNGGAE